MSRNTTNLTSLYRPRRFRDVVGQKEATEGLRLAVARGRVRSSYLLLGPRGSGKTSTARILAAAVNCPNAVDGEPCGACASCDILDEDQFEDWYREVKCAREWDRESIIEVFNSLDFGTRVNRKVFFLDEAHALSDASMTVMLGFSERILNDTLILFATTEPDRLLPTLRSRCIHVPFRRVADADLAALVGYVGAQEGIDLDPARIEAIVQQGDGSPRDALSALDGLAHGVEPTGESYPARIVAAMARSDVGGVIRSIQEASAAGQFHAGVVADLAARYWLDALALRVGDVKQFSVPASLRPLLPASSREPEEAISARLGMLLDARLREPVGLSSVTTVTALLIRLMSATGWDRHLSVVGRLDAVEAHLRELLGDAA